MCHSQRLGDPPLRPWISIKLDGEVVCAHCTCIAGVGEACSHIGATLFALETSIKLLKNTACTSMPCEWLRTSAQKIEYAEGASIEFVSPRRKFNEVRCESIGRGRTHRRPTSASLVPPTSTEATGFYASLAATGSKCSVLSIVSPYCEAYIPRAVTHKLPQPLPDALLDDNYVLTSDFAVLETKCASVFASMSFTAEETVTIECETRGQGSSNAWFRYRAGRVTASNFKAAARTQAANPGNLSRSLIKRICYPATARFTTAATTWGCEHETEAVTAYETIITTSHTSVSVSHSPGLHINPCFPHLGASPDAIIECSCHGRGMVEVKCPYCKRGNPMEDAADDPKFCLQKNSDGVLSLKTSHQYYYQVQTQLFVSGLPYYDFVVFSGSNNIFIQRIVPDNEFWEVANAHVRQFYISGILPELVGKWYTRLSVRTEDAPPADTLLCYCRKPATDVDMLVCCEATCKIGRYHRQCLGLKTVPKRVWRCPDCRKLAKKSK